MMCFEQAASLVRLPLDPRDQINGMMGSIKTPCPAHLVEREGGNKRRFAQISQEREGNDGAPNAAPSVSCPEQAVSSRGSTKKSENADLVMPLFAFYDPYS